MECINLYHDNEDIIDEMLTSALEELHIDLDLYYNDNDGIFVQ